MIALFIIIYFSVCIYTLFIWVTLVNRIRQKRYEAAIYRAFGFFALYIVSVFPFLFFVPFYEIFLITSFFLLFASFFSTSTIKPPRLKSQSHINPYRPITPEEVANYFPVSFTPEFTPKPILAIKQVRLLEAKSENLWEDFQNYPLEKFWENYNALLVEMKNINQAKVAITTPKDYTSDW